MQLLNRRCQNCVLRVREVKKTKKSPRTTGQFFWEKKSPPRAPLAQREKTTKTLTHPAGTTLNSDGSLRMVCAVVLLHDGV